MNRFRKTFSRIVAFLLILCLFTPSIAALATETPKYTIASKVAAPEEEVTIDVLLENSSAVYGGNFTLRYDSSLLEIMDYTYGSNLSNHTKNCNLDYQSLGNQIRFTFSGSSAVTEDGTIVSFTFKVIGPVKSEARFEFTAYKAYGSAGNSLEATCGWGNVIIENSPVGFLSVESLEVEAGSQFPIYLKLNNGIYVAGANIVLQYDDSLLEPVKYGFSSQLENYTKSTQLISLEEGAGIKVSFRGNEPLNSVKPTIIGFMFEAKEGVSGTATFELPTFHVYAANGTEIKGSAEGGDLTITAPEVSSIDIGEDLTGYAGISSFELSATTLPEGVAAGTISWSSNNTSVASVSDEGLLNLLTAGEATITATCENGVSDSLVVTSKEVPQIVQNESQFIQFDDGEARTYCKFVPTETGTYKFTIRIDGNGGFGIGTSGCQIWGMGAMEVTHELTAGETYYFTCEIAQPASYSIEVKKTISISNMEILSYPKQMTYYEGLRQTSYSGLQLLFTFSDGTTEVWTYDMSFDVGGEHVSVNDVYANNRYSYTEIKCANKSVRFSFTIIPNPVESIEIYSGEMPVFVENTGGYLYEGVYRYENCQPFHMIFQINYADGSSCIAKVFDKVNGYSVDWKNTQYDEPWVVGTNYLEVSYCNKTVKVPVTVVPQDNAVVIDHISLDSMPTHTYIWGDAEYGSCSDGVYYFEATNFEGMVLTVHYTDGSSKTYRGEDVHFESDLYYIGDEYLVIDSFVEATEPGIYEGVLSIQAHDVSYNFELVETTVTDIEIIENPTQSIQEEGFVWNFNGMKIKITYKDGTDKVVEVTDSNTTYEFLWGYLYTFVEVDGSRIVIEPYYGEHIAYLISYMGQEIEYFETEYKENSIQSVNVLNPTVDKEKFKDLILEVTYADGTSEKISPTLIGANFTTQWVAGYIKTKGGVSYFYISEESELGILKSYEIGFLGQNVIIAYTPEQLTVTEKPTKLEYQIGEELNLNGLELQMKYDNGEKTDLKSGYTISSFDSTTAGLKTITITSAGLSTSFVVKVIDDTANESDGKIVVQDCTANKGNQVKVTISLENNPGIISAMLKVHYDSSVMTLVGVEDKGNLGGVMHSNQYTNPYVLSWANDTITENITFNGEVVTLVFDVAEDASVGEYVVGVTYDYDNNDICNYDLESVKFQVVDGIVKVIDTIIGDVNGDGKVNTLDRITLARYLANWEGYTTDSIDLVASDVNGDGKVNTLDRITLARYLANWEGYDELPYTN